MVEVSSRVTDAERESVAENELVNEGDELDVAVAIAVCDPVVLAEGCSDADELPDNDRECVFSGVSDDVGVGEFVRVSMHVSDGVSLRDFVVEFR